MNWKLLTVSVMVIASEAAAGEGCRAQPTRSNIAAAAVALAAVPFDSLTALGPPACPTIVIDEQVRFSEGTPIRNDNLPVVFRLSAGEATALRTRCSDVQLKALPVLPDTADAINQVQRVRLFQIGKGSDSAKRFLALISPPGLANPIMVFVDLTWKGARWTCQGVTFIQG
ncbi:MAG TPA: hypothetical protein VN803_05905 [Gemmatimonadales bacterium]|nr:hypothetical protein [Gemmatimonadales bacterium]